MDIEGGILNRTQETWPTQTNYIKVFFDYNQIDKLKFVKHSE